MTTESNRRYGIQGSDWITRRRGIKLMSNHRVRMDNRQDVKVEKLPKTGESTRCKTARSFLVCMIQQFSIIQSFTSNYFSYLSICSGYSVICQLPPEDSVSQESIWDFDVARFLVYLTLSTSAQFRALRSPLVVAL